MRPAVVAAFLSRGSAIFDYSVSALRMYAWSFLVMGFNVIFAGFFTAMERPLPAFTISVSRSLVLLAASLTVMSLLFGDQGIWFSTLVSEVACLILTVGWTVSYFRRL